MTRRFSLGGAAFAFHCLPPTERHELTALLQSNNGALYMRHCGSSAGCDLTVTRSSSRPRGLATCGCISRCSRPGRVDADGGVTMQDPSPLGSTGHRMRLPCSPSFLFRGEVPLWPYITAMLAQPIRDTHDLSSRLQLVTLSDPRRRFNCLEYAVNELLKHEEQTKFFRDVLPEMARLVLNMPQLFATPPPLLTPLEADEHAESNSVSSSGATQAGESSDSSNKARVATQTHRFTKLEVLTLVCGCFFGIFPEQDIVKCVQPDDSPQNKKAGRRSSNDDDVIEFPYFTAVRMFSAPGNMGRLVVLKAQKIRCLLQYFLRVVPRALSDRTALSTEVIDFTRRIRPEQTPQELLKMLEPGESNTDAVPHPQLCGARCVSDTLIEDLDKHLQIDFANKFAGGGVLNSGCVQEEIRFLLSPELLVSCLVFAKLEPHEAFVIHGTERYSAYQGYGAGTLRTRQALKLHLMAAYADSALSWGLTQRIMARRGWNGSTRVATSGAIWSRRSLALLTPTHTMASCGGQLPREIGAAESSRAIESSMLAASIRQRELVYVLFERDLDLQTKVDPLLTLATCAKAREWDRQSGGVMQWLTEFLFNELSAGRGTRGVQSVLTRASRSLEQALASLQLPPKNQQQDTESELKQLPQDSPVSLGSKQEPSATPRREEPSVGSSEATKKKPKTMHQMTMQDFFSTK
ncbi:Poly(ADP-ribose) glycohydrolase [Phytophthora cactorum]|nr:Poly(ADP-ribose) glycohydrolase [Phytophthora cactorum]